MAKKSKKRYTLPEFKAWLAGIEELQSDDWAPDVNQWKTIREKLMSIVEKTPPPAAPQPVQPQQNFREPGPAMVRQQPPMMQQPTALPPSSLDNVATPEMTPAAAAALAGNLPTNMVPDAEGKLKTPNIDTTDGNFNSSFE